MSDVSRVACICRRSECETLLQHECELSMPISPHWAAIFAQQARSSCVSCAPGRRQAIAGAANNSSIRAKATHLAADFTASSVCSR